MRRRARLLSAGIALSLVGSLAGCGGGDSDNDRTITVLAASSLTGTFTDLAHTFEQEHPGVHVKLAFDSSATLAQQAVEGAPADVLATADRETMDGAAEALAADPQLFAGNLLDLVTPADDPADVASVQDLDRRDVQYVVCVETAPCGKLARKALDSYGITNPPASLEIDVKAVLTKVTSGEADAGFVYNSDAVAAGDAVRHISFAKTQGTVYYVAPLQQSERPTLAQQFVDLVLSNVGKRVLLHAGFTRAYEAD
jgi:molybdate transport system substrate-binding protein